ncbi:acyl-CoA thioesterase [Larkinella soli]|uniref:acyl-CoA thioesterase n=1 Tax=Larkinella soli TaxID=1770527 RepID=UPI000FFC43D6|nr:acyl-CoA thioesterase [Larkinella soli]
MIILDPSKTYPTETESRVMIRFQDCDPLQHLNNSKYFDYYFNAREDQVAKLYNFSLLQLFREYNTSWVVYQHQIAYVRPAMVSEWIRIRSRLIYCNEDTLVTEYYMTDDGGKQLKNVLWMTSKYVSVLTGKRIPHSPEVMDFLNTICVRDVDFHNLSFNERIKQIKKAVE